MTTSPYLSTPDGASCAILGGGRVGRALALALHQQGLPPGCLWSRQAATAEKAHRATGLNWMHGPSLPDLSQARTIILAVSESAIFPLAQELGRCWGPAQPSPEGESASPRPTEPVVIHCAGSCSAQEVLAPLAKKASLGLFHPLLAIADPARGARDLTQGSFALQGQARAVAAGAQLAQALGAGWFELQAQDLALYHTGAALASNLAGAIWTAVLRMLESQGVPAPTAHQALAALIQSTAANFAAEAMPQGLTGPVRRGDQETVERHLTALTSHAPSLLPLYCHGSLLAAHLVKSLTLPGVSATSIDKIIKLLQKAATQTSAQP